jgi:hypothetical protein
MRRTVKLKLTIQNLVHDRQSARNWVAIIWRRGPKYERRFLSKVDQTFALPDELAPGDYLEFCGDRYSVLSVATGNGRSHFMRHRLYARVDAISDRTLTLDDCTLEDVSERPRSRSVANATTADLVAELQRRNEEHDV